MMTDAPKTICLIEAIPQPWRRAITQQQDKIEAQAARIAELEAALKTAREDALKEACNVDFRTLWVKNFNRMRKAGESHIMAGRWFPQLCQDAIYALLAKDTSHDG